MTSVTVANHLHDIGIVERNVSLDPSYEIHIKCLKGHSLCETNPLFCKDYDFTNEPFEWKLQFMRDIDNWNWELDYEK